MIKKEQILVIDDSENVLEIVWRNLSQKGYVVYTVTNVIDGISFLESTPIDLVITDLKMPNINGIEMVRHVKENFKHTEVLVITGFPSIEAAVESVKLGAEEFLIKPFTDEELFRAVSVALKKLSDRELINGIDEGEEKPVTGIIGDAACGLL